MLVFLGINYSITFVGMEFFCEPGNTSSQQGNMQIALEDPLHVGR